MKGRRSRTKWQSPAALRRTRPCTCRRREPCGTGGANGRVVCTTLAVRQHRLEVHHARRGLHARRLLPCKRTTAQVRVTHQRRCSGEGRGWGWGLAPSASGNRRVKADSSARAATIVVTHGSGGGDSLRPAQGVGCHPVCGNLVCGLRMPSGLQGLQGRASTPAGPAGPACEHLSETAAETLLCRSVGCRSGISRVAVRCQGCVHRAGPHTKWHAPPPAALQASRLSTSSPARHFAPPSRPLRRMQECRVRRPPRWQLACKAETSCKAGHWWRRSLGLPSCMRPRASSLVGHLRLHRSTFRGRSAHGFTGSRRCWLVLACAGLCWLGLAARRAIARRRWQDPRRHNKKYWEHGQASVR